LYLEVEGTAFFVDEGRVEEDGEARSWCCCWLDDVGLLLVVLVLLRRLREADEAEVEAEADVEAVGCWRGGVPWGERRLLSLMWVCCMGKEGKGCTPGRRPTDEERLREQ